MNKVSQLWSDRPWRRKGQSTAKNTAQDEPAYGDSGLAAAIERNVQRLSRLWKNDAHEPPTRRHSTKPLKTRRSFFRPNDEPTLVPDDTAEEENTAPPLERETLLKRIRRKSQTFSLQRPSTSTGVPKRRSFFGTTDLDADDEDVPPVPTLIDLQGFARPRHVPITIDTPGYTNEQPPPVTGMAITSNEVQTANHAFVEKPRRPMSSSSNFSQIRTRAARTTFHSPPQATASDSSDDEDVLTALPSMDFKEFSVGELRNPNAIVSVPVQMDRRSMSLKRVTPKVIDIVAPRPLSMFSPPPARKEVVSKERHKSMTQPVTASLIGAMDEDGPKGDWSRTRNSWVGFGEGESEQLEWDKLKQFMEAYGNGQDGGIISVRAVGTDSSDSSERSRDSHGI